MPLPPPPLVAYPAPGKPPADFAQDDAGCRAAAQGQTAAAAPDAVPAAYLQCMAARGNIIQPLVPVRTPAYAYAVPDPMYPGGDYAPFYTGGFVGFGAGCCYGRGYYEGGFRRFYR